MPQIMELVKNISFFSKSTKTVEEISEVEVYEHTGKGYIIVDNADLTSIPKLYKKIIKSIENTKSKNVSNTL